MCGSLQQQQQQTSISRNKYVHRTVLHIISFFGSKTRRSVHSALRRNYNTDNRSVSRKSYAFPPPHPLPPIPLPRLPLAARSSYGLQRNGVFIPRKNIKYCLHYNNRSNVSLLPFFDSVRTYVHGPFRCVRRFPSRKNTKQQHRVRTLLTVALNSDVVKRTALCVPLVRGKQGRTVTNSLVAQSGPFGLKLNCIFQLKNVYKKNKSFSIPLFKLFLFQLTQPFPVRHATTDRPTDFIVVFSDFFAYLNVGV